MFNIGKAAFDMDTPSIKKNTRENHNAPLLIGDLC